MINCLLETDPLVKEWIAHVGRAETYRQYILNGYYLPSYNSYAAKSAEFNIDIENVRAILNQYFDSSTFSIEDISKLEGLSYDELGAFFKNVLYFNRSTDVRVVNEEAFHAIFQTLTTDEQRSMLYQFADKILQDRGEHIDTYKEYYKEVLGREVSDEFIKEEILAKEWVRWITYEQNSDTYNTPIEEDSLLGRIMTAVRNFFKKLRSLFRAYKRDPKTLESFFEMIRDGRFKNTMRQSVDNEITRDYPSLSTIKVISRKTDQESVLSTVEQSVHYGRIINIIQQLRDERLVTEEGIFLSPKQLIEQAVTLYRDEVLAYSEKDSDKEFYDALYEEFIDRTVAFETVISDIEYKLRKIDIAISEFDQIDEAQEDDIGGFKTEFSDSEANQRDPYLSLSQEIKTVIGTTVIESSEGDSDIRIEVNKIINGEVVKVPVNIKNRRLVDPNKVYNATISVVANTSNHREKIKKLIIYTRDRETNTETRAFLDHILREAYTKGGEKITTSTELEALKQAIVDDHENPDGFELSNTNFFFRILKSMHLSTREVRIMNFLKGNKTSSFNPLFSEGRLSQIAKWELAFRSRPLEDQKRDFEKITRTGGLLFQKSAIRSNPGVIRNRIAEFKTTKLSKATGQPISDLVTEPLLSQEELTEYLNYEIGLMMEELDLFTSLLSIDISRNFKRWIIANEINNIFSNEDLALEIPYAIILPSEYSEVYSNFFLSNQEFHVDFASRLDTIRNSFTEEYFNTRKFDLAQDPYSGDVSEALVDNSEKEGEEEAVGKRDIVHNMKSELEALSMGNMLFDESVLPTSYRNAEDKSVYRFQLQTQFLKFINETIKSKDKFNEYVNRLLQEADSNKYYFEAVPGVNYTGNFVVNFFNSLTNAERSRLRGESLGGVIERSSTNFTSDDIGVSNDIDGIRFSLYQYNLPLHNSFLLRRSIGLPTDANYREAEIIAHYFKGINETSKTKSFITAKWYNQVMSYYYDENNQLRHGRKPLMQIAKDKSFTGVGDGAVSLAKTLIQQDLSRIIHHKLLYEDSLQSLFGSASEHDQKAQYNLNQKDLQEAGFDKIFSEFHTGRVHVKWDSIEKRWLMDLEAMQKDSKSPRAFKYMVDTSGYLNSSAIDILNELVEEGYEYIEQWETTPENRGKKEELDKQIKIALGDLIIKSYVDLGEQVEYLDARFDTKDGDNMTQNLRFVLRDGKIPFTGNDNFLDFPAGTSVYKQYNFGLVVLNTILNRTAIQRMLHGDLAITNKNDNKDIAKRNKAEEAAKEIVYNEFNDFEKGVEAFTELKHIVLEGDKSGSVSGSIKQTAISSVDGQKIDSDDGQGYTSVYSRKQYLHGLTKLTAAHAELLDKIHNGEDYTDDEIDSIIENKRYINSEKSIASSPNKLFKMSEAVITKKLTAYKHEITEAEAADVKSKWQEYIDLHLITYDNSNNVKSFQIYPKPGQTKEYTIELVYGVDTPYANKQIALEAAMNGDLNAFRMFEWISLNDELNTKRLILDGWVYKNGRLEFGGRDKRVNMIVTDSASKKVKENIWDGRAESFSQDFHVRSISTDFYGRQQPNIPKDKIIDPTQQLEILTSFIPEGDFALEGKNGKVIVRGSKLISDFHSLLARRDTNSLNIFKQIFEADSDEIRIDILYKIVQDTLASSGGDKQLLELFNLDSNGNIMYNSNIPPSIVKFEQQALSLIGKSIFSHKVKGESYAMMSPKGMKIMKRLKIVNIDGQDVYTWDVIKRTDPEYGKLFMSVKDKKGLITTDNNLTYNGFDTDPAKNTLISEFFQKNNIKDGDIFFDDLRFNKPRIMINNERKPYIDNYYAETLIPPKDRRELYTDEDYENRYIQGVRIPSQTKSTSANMEIVDYLDVVYGNTVMVAKEIQQMAGADFDIDKIYVHQYEGKWTSSGKFVRYENTREDFLNYMFSNDKAVNREFQDRLHEDKELQTLYNINQLLKENNDRDIEILISSETNQLENRDDLKTVLSVFRTIKRLDAAYDRYIDNEEKLADIVNKIVEQENVMRRLVKSLNLSEADKSLINLIIVRKESIKNNRNTIKKKRNAIKKQLVEDMFPEGIDFHNPAFLNNEILDQKKLLLTANIKEGYSAPQQLDYLHDLLSGSASGNVHNILDKDGKPLKLDDDIIYPYGSVAYDAKYIKSAEAGKNGITHTVLGNLAWLVNVRAGSKLTSLTKFGIQGIPSRGDEIISIEGFAKEILTLPPDQRAFVADKISEIISAATDEAKEGILSRLNLDDNLLPLYMVGLSLGIDPQILVATFNTDFIQKLSNKALFDKFNPGEKTTIKSLLKEMLTEVAETNSIELDDLLKKENVIPFDLLVDKKESADGDYAKAIFLYKLILVYDQNNDLMRPTRLKKGLPSTSLQYRDIYTALRKLGVSTSELFSEQDISNEKHNAYDINWEAAGFEQVKNNIEVMLPEISEILSKILLQLNDNYSGILGEAKTLVNINGATKAEINKGLNRALLGTLLNNYERLTGRDGIGEYSKNLDVNLLIGDKSLVSRFIQLKEHPELKDLLNKNLLFNRAIPLVAVQKAMQTIARRKRLNKSYQVQENEILKRLRFDNFLLSTYSKMTPEIQASYNDAIHELRMFNQSTPEINALVNKFAEDLFHFITVRDSLEFSPSSINKILPTTDYKNVSDLYDLFMRLDKNNPLHTRIISAITKETIDRFVKDNKNQKYLKNTNEIFGKPTSEEEEALKEANTAKDFVPKAEKAVKYKEFGKSVIQYNVILSEKNMHKSAPRYAVKSKKGIKYLYKRIAQEDVKTPDGKVMRSFYYIEIPLEGTPNYSSSISNKNIVMNERMALEIKSNLTKALDHPELKTKGLIIKLIKEEIQRIDDLYVLRIVNSEDELLGTNFINKGDTIKAKLVPISDIHKVNYLDIDINDPLSFIGRKEVTINGRKFYNVFQYMTYTQARFYKYSPEQIEMYGTDVIHTPLTTDNKVLEKAWALESFKVLDYGLRHAFNTPELRAYLKSLALNNVVLTTSDVRVRQTLDILYQIIEDAKEDKDLVASFINDNKLYKSKGVGVELDIPSTLPTEVKRREHIKALNSDAYIVFSSEDTGTATEMYNKLPEEYKKAEGVGSVVTFGFNDKKYVTQTDMNNYIKYAIDHLSNGGVLITDTLNNMHYSNQDTLSPNEKYQVDGVVGPRKLFYKIMTEVIGIKPELRFLRNPNSPNEYTSAYVWSGYSADMFSDVESKLLKIKGKTETSENNEDITLKPMSEFKLDILEVLKPANKNSRVFNGNALEYVIEKNDKQIPHLRATNLAKYITTGTLDIQLERTSSPHTVHGTVNDIFSRLFFDRIANNSEVLNDAEFIKSFHRLFIEQVEKELQGSTALSDIRYELNQASLFATLMNNAISQLHRLINFLETNHPGKEVVYITEEILLTGALNQILEISGKKFRNFAGTPDMLIFVKEEDGIKLYIADFKSKKVNSRGELFIREEDMEDYNLQLNIYKEAIESSSNVEVKGLFNIFNKASYSVTDSDQVRELSYVEYNRNDSSDFIVEQEIGTPKYIGPINLTEIANEQGIPEEEINLEDYLVDNKDFLDFNKKCL